MIVFRRAFLSATIVWTAALPAATWSAGRLHEPGWAAALAIAVYAVGAAVCHQLPARSFHFGVAQMPVCARCTGIYLGAAVAALVALVSRTSAAAGGGREAHSARRLVAVAAVPTALTLAFEWATGVTPSNGLRALAGLPLGAAIVWVIDKSVR
jgi:uncharacterized membrane protein